MEPRPTEKVAQKLPESKAGAQSQRPETCAWSSEITLSLVLNRSMRAFPLAALQITTHSLPSNSTDIAVSVVWGPRYHWLSAQCHQANSRVGQGCSLSRETSISSSITVGRIQFLVVAEGGPQVLNNAHHSLLCSSLCELVLCNLPGLKEHLSDAFFYKAHLLRSNPPRNLMIP